MWIFKQSLISSLSEYYLELDETQQDYLSITDAELDTNVPPAGNWAYGGRVTVPVINPDEAYTLFGKTFFGIAGSRYGCWIGASDELIVQGNNESEISISNFITTYGGQDIDLMIQYEGLEVVAYVAIVVNEEAGPFVEIGRGTLLFRPVPDPKSFFIGAYGDNTGLAAQSGLYYDGKIHSFFIGEHIWKVNEGSGNFVKSNVGAYKANIFTSSIDINYINDFMWQLLNP